MKILGIHDGHNASVCLIVDGKIKWVLQEERLRHEKNFDGFPELSIKKIMAIEQLDYTDIDAIILNGNHQPKPMGRLERLEAYNNLGSSKNIIKSLLKRIKPIDSLYQKIHNRDRVNNLYNLGFHKNKIHFIEHHQAHAAATYYANNNFEDNILIFTNDGAGDRICATVSIGKNGKMQRIQEVHENHSVGLLYAMFTFLTGMVPLEHEYKIMGMAPYADAKAARKIANEFHAMFQLSQDGLSWQFIKGKSIYSSLNFFKEFMYLKRFDHLMGGLQLFIEEFLVNWIKSAIKKTGINNIALSGGTFMNVKANKLIMEMEEVHKIFIFPSCGDESNAIGCAYEYISQVYGYQCIQKLKDIYLGIEWSDETIKESYDIYKFKHNYTIQYYSDIEVKSAKLLADNNVIARFKGREEFGARSLGNRAILGNPSGQDVIKTINELIKNRDFWMPFASSILDTDIDRYVKINDKNDPYYMIMTYDTKDEEAKEITGGIHPYDKTIRPQMVTQGYNQAYWNLIKEFKKLTGIGGVLNTSLNLHGLPLVYSPEDAFEVIEKSRLKYLAIGNYLITKKED